MIYLRSTNSYGERHWLAHLGGPWPSDPTKRLIDRTVTSLKDAKSFGTIEEARTILAVTDNLRNKHWEIVDEAGNVLK